VLNPPIDRPGQILRDLIARDTIVMPGVFNALSARAAFKSGASALYLTGAGITNANFGMPDIALATLTEFAETASRVTAVAPLPVLSDADTGFGETLNVRRTVIEMERAGLAGIHIEDQVSPKRCGHLDGKELIATTEMARKIGAAVGAKRDGSFMVVARTDARGVEGLEGTLERARAYVDAGADAIFPEGMISEDEFAAVRRAVDVPLIANMTEFGKTPIIPASRFRELGYEMVIFPMTALRVALKAIGETYEELLSTGTQAGILDRMRTRAELYGALDYDAYIELDASLEHGHR